MFRKPNRKLKTRAERARSLVNSLESLRQDLTPEDFAPDTEIPVILNQNAARLLQLVARTALAPRSI